MDDDQRDISSLDIPDGQRSKSLRGKTKVRKT